MSQETPSRQLLLLFILSFYQDIDFSLLPISYWVRETDTASNVSPTTSLSFLLPLLLIYSALMVRFAPHLICNSSISCGSGCTFLKICSWKNMLWNGDLFYTVTNNVQQRLLSCFVGRLSLQVLSTSQWKQKCFYHNALCLVRKWRSYIRNAKEKKRQWKAKTYCHELFSCRESHQMSAQPVLCFSRTSVSQEMCHVYEKCLSVNWLSLQSLC